MYSSYYGYGYNNYTGGFVGTTMIVYLIIFGLIGLFMLISLWKIFTKAGKGGWITLIPIYNFWVLFEIADMPGWLAIIPFANTIAMLVAYYKLALKFGKSSGFAVLTIFFPIICLPIIAFGKNTYDGGEMFYNNNRPMPQGMPNNNPNNMNNNPNMNSSQPQNMPNNQNMGGNIPNNNPSTMNNNPNMNYNQPQNMPNNQNMGGNIPNNNPSTMNNNPNMNYNQQPNNGFVEQQVTNPNVVISNGTNENKATKVCPKCGTVLEANLKFCDNCGTELQ